MIILGLLCMFFFLEELISLGTDCLPLYIMLMLTLAFACLKIVHEWVHYLFITVPKTPELAHKPTVDVFTTFCAGEPYDMIKETLVAIKNISYPHETYLCDEANDPYLKSFCAEIGVHHVTRPVKINAKAGNINNALKISSGELCLVLDPDHVPYPDFLDPVVSHFDDPQIGFIQVVQSYKNQDQTLIAKGAAQQTYQFYGPMMMTMNAYGTVPAIGANCTFRRAALESIGGHAAGLAEDMHTAMQLHARGWKSKYIPSVVARGLVPATLSAYYKQQLKWSRGVFELLFSSYPRLFNKFTWQQKLHYGTIPLFYLSGLFYLINFLIPVISLVFDTSPVNIDFSIFFTLGLPLATAIILIRHFVQKWVMDEEERGFHLVGGLLMIGTWWVHLLGFYYTLLRKDVPYDPTPKDGNEENNWHLNVPNIAVIIISLAAAIYGVNNDFNPYNLFMSGFAVMNCLLIAFTIAASRQTPFRKYKEKHDTLRIFMLQVAAFKKLFWLFRRFVYKGVRGAALILTMMVVCFSIYIIESKQDDTVFTQTVPDRRNILIPGIYAPSGVAGLPSMKTADSLGKAGEIDFGIISLYLSWGDQQSNQLPEKLIDSIYQNKAVPMITWEPWQSLFKQNEGKSQALKEQKVFARIVNGEYDQYLRQFSSQVAALRKPIFIRFAHETDNPQYPWSPAGDNSPEEFIQAWRYIHHFFQRQHASNVIWVWNPWKPTAVEKYFPGKPYVDWIGVTNLNYADQNPDHQSYSMEQLYTPFRMQTAFKLGIPVMLAEMGSLGSGSSKTDWFREAFLQINKQFQEIKAVVFFNSGADKNTIDSQQKAPLDWRIEDFKAASAGLVKNDRHNSWLANDFLMSPLASKVANHNIKKSDFKLNDIRGVNYVNDQNWRLNYQNLKKREIEDDFAEMKRTGINAIKHYGPNIYDHNILTVAKKENLQVIYSFWLLRRFDYLNDSLALNDYADKILETVRKFKDNRSIVMWNIGNTPIKRIEQHFYKPDMLYHRQAYMLWLSKLVKAIKAEDNSRPLSVDLGMSTHISENAELLHTIAPLIDNIALVNGKDTLTKLPNISTPYYLSNLRVDNLLMLKNLKKGVMIRNWQDQRTDNYVSFDGLKDLDGHVKDDLYQLGRLWKGLKPVPEMPEIRILKPATTLIEKNTVTYYLLNPVNGEWKLLRNEEAALKFTWWLVREDDFGNTLDMKQLGEGAQINVRVPRNPSNYKLYVYIMDGERVKIIKSTLNTPLY